jgi:hypothetical protein
MLNHRARNVLVGIYDRDGRWAERINIAETWVAKVLDVRGINQLCGKLPKVPDESLPPSSQPSAFS